MLRTALLAVAIALAFADSSIVVLALPDLLREYDASIEGVAWVVTSYNVVVAVGAFALIPLVRRRNPARVTAVGLAVFAAASAACAAATSVPLLVAFRAVQGAGAALLLAGVLPLLVATVRSVPRATAVWALTGTVGAAIGPALGGLLTQLADWRAIFAAQAPVAVLALLATLRPPVAAPVPEARSAGVRVLANVSLALVSGALVGALFLGVVMLVDAWRYSPLAAAAIVSAIPLATIAARPLSTRASVRTTVACGALALAGGLAALALLPAARLVWAVPALVLCGLGLGLAAPLLTRASLAGAADAGRAGTISVGARHAGLVLALLLVAPLLSTDVAAAESPGERGGIAAILDAELSARQKVRLALDIDDEIERTPPGEFPDLASVFARHERSEPYRTLERRLDEVLEATVTRSFRRAFALCALLAVAAAVTAAFLRREPR